MTEPLMSGAFDSTLHISFDVRGGLLMRQTHHWAALVFVAAMYEARQTVGVFPR
ncbi:hypothetical protein AB0D59_27695 [Streptomyces sp. NPDC048417]|uniref:hypothetical protein n=1 Tax=Streptomyces sp. NPDC048417 TaxID=3155387 RepID=UPI00342A13F1